MENDETPKPKPAQLRESIPPLEAPQVSLITGLAGLTDGINPFVV